MEYVQPDLVVVLSPRLGHALRAVDEAIRGGLVNAYGHSL